VNRRWSVAVLSLIEIIIDARVCSVTGVPAGHDCIWPEGERAPLLLEPHDVLELPLARPTTSFASAPSTYSLNVDPSASARSGS
jgi:hypothetical protein